MPYYNKKDSVETNAHKRAEALLSGWFVFVSPRQDTAPYRDVEGMRHPEYSTTNPNFWQTPTRDTSSGESIELFDCPMAQNRFLINFIYISR
jgi:hypothetical protein